MIRRRAAALALTVALATGGVVSAHDASRDAPAVVLDVPFVAQSEDLCGGAAAAMVMRYWGARSVNAESFAAISTAANRGISTEALVRALSSQGWHAYALSGTATLVQHHLAAGRPVVALISISPTRRHYVVIVSWTPRHVLYHDPAVLPLRTVAPEEFERAWSGTSRWMLLVLPPRDGTGRTSTTEERRAPPVSCEAQVARGIALASNEQLSDAGLVLSAAHGACPESAVPLTELAGVQLLRSDYRGAEVSALQAVTLEPGDRHAWRIIATSRFLRHEESAALDAWNQAGELLLDVVNVEGLRRTTQATIERTIAILPGSVLTSRELAMARRRLQDVPAASATRLDYVPAGAGQTELHAAVVEPAVLPTAWTDLAGLGMSAAVNREVAWTFTSPTRNGEAITASWRWWDRRPRVALGAAIPVAAGINGVLTLEGSLQRETFSDGLAGATSLSLDRSDRRTFRVGFSSWARPWLRWTAAVGADRWDTLGAFPDISAGADVRAARDRLALGATVTAWAGQSGFASVTTGARWRSRTNADGAVTMLAVDGAFAGAGAPRDLWPGADVGQARPFLLRGHPLLADGIITGEAFGRQLAHATGEWQSRARSLLLLRLCGAIFADGARAWHGPATRDRTLIDVGAGVRVGVPGQSTLRIDYAHGLVDGANAVSVGWTTPWPAAAAHW